MTSACVAQPKAAQKQMTAKDRWRAALRLQPVDRLPFWPKLSGAYGKAQTGKWQGPNLQDLHAFIGSDRHDGMGDCVAEVRPNCRAEVTGDASRRTTVWHTPKGSARMVQQYDAASDSWHPMEFPIKTAADIEIMRAWYVDARVELDSSALEKTRAQQRALGDAASTHTTCGESPLMHFVEWLAGVENAHYLLADHTEQVEALFAEMHRVLLARTKILAEVSPVDMLYFGENTSTTLISPAQYRRYCFVHLLEYATVVQQFRKPVVLHMCGHLKALLPDLAKLPVAAFEAFTSPTLGNTTLLDGRTGCPDKCLVGGTNAMLWLESPAAIIATLKRDLDALPHHRGIVVTSAGVMPPACRPETIREVAEWVRNYPARV
jgi:uroporphyrinogen-III decarboxylase